MANVYFLTVNSVVYFYPIILVLMNDYTHTNPLTYYLSSNISTLKHDQ